MKKLSLILLLFLCLGLNESYAVENTCLTPKGGVAPAFLPDGKTIMFVREDSEGEKQLFTKAIGDVKAPAKAAGLQGESVLVVDGKIICFNGPFFALNIMLYSPESKTAEKINVENPPNGMAFPFGKKQIIYPSGFGEDTKLIAVDLELKKQIPLTAKLPVGTQAVSPDQKLAAVAFRNEQGVNTLKVIELESGKTVWLAKTYASSGGMEIGGCHSAAFSPDGKKLAYVSAGIQPIADIYQLDLSSKKVKRLTHDEADNQSPVYSADGKSIVYSSARNSGYRVWMLSLD